MAAPQSLPELQRWLMHAICQPNDSLLTEAIVLPSRQQSAAERLAVYQHAYGARLLECMRELFPVLHATLAEGFDAFAVEYLERHPPTSYSLNHLAEQFVDFLLETRPPNETGEADWVDFLIDLARLEFSIDQLFDGPGAEALPLLNTAQLAILNAEDWLRLRLLPVPCLRLHEFRFPINGFYTAAKRSESPEWPTCQTEFVALTRRDFIVRRISLSAGEYALLSALIAGKSIGEALEGTQEPFSMQPKQVRDWFASWGRLGFFSGYTDSPQR